MGRVYEAEDQQLGRHVAVKVIRDDLDDPVSRQRFFREARAAAALSHPNACHLYEVGEHESEPFLVMELLHGESLSCRLARGPLPSDEAVTLLLPLMEALSALHGAGLIHRDLKPANTFLTPQGVKLLDFGLARRTERSGSLTATALTVPGAVTGTMRYMAPEQLTGDPVDVRTDVFALGVLLFEMLTGRIPFGTSSNMDWVKAVLRDEPVTLDDPALRPFEPVVQRALQRRPEDRFHSVDEMAAALRAAALGREATGAGAEPRVPTETAPAVEPEASGGTSLVVLPFRLLQPDPEIAVLEQGMPEALTAQLSNEPGLRVLSNRVAQQFAEAPDLTTIAATLRADRLVTGSLLRSGEAVRVTVQLVDGRDAAVCWSQTTEHVLASVLDLEKDICTRTLDGLKAALAKPGQEHQAGRLAERVPVAEQEDASQTTHA